MPIEITHINILHADAEAIVNPTDERYSGSGGVDLAIHTAAGEALDAACRRLAPLSVGAVAVTPGFSLPQKYIFHTRGPIWQGGSRNEAILLRSCYQSALFKARELGLHSIAFPLISSGTFGFPKDQVLNIAINAIRELLLHLDGDLNVYLCIFDRHSYEISRRPELEAFLNQREEACYAPSPCCAAPAPEAKTFAARLLPRKKEPTPTAPAPAALSCTLDDWLKQQDDSFAVTLLKLIDQKGMTDVQCYKKANISKKTFWKINNDPTYRPSKPTVLAFAIALELTLPETNQLLRTVGFSLSHSSTFDMIIEFYIRRGIYDIYEINSALYQFDQMCLGC